MCKTINGMCMFTVKLCSWLNKCLFNFELCDKLRTFYFKDHSVFIVGNNE